MKRTILSAGMAACLLAAAGFAAAAAPELPAGCFGYAYLPNVDKTLGGITQFAEKLNLPTASLVFLKGSLGMLLENADLSAVDLKGPLCIVLLNPKENPDPWAACFRLANPDAYCKGLGKTFTLKSSDEKTGVRVYTSQSSVFDSEAYAAASPDEQTDPGRFYKTTERSLMLALRGNSAWLSYNPALFETLRGFSATEFAGPLDANLSLVFMTDTLAKLAKEEFDKNLPKLEAAAGQTQSPFGPGATTKMLTSYADLYLHYLEQISRVTVGITVDGSGVVLEKLIQAAAGSKLAEFLGYQKSGTLGLARYLDPDAWLVVDARIQRPQMLYGLYEKVFTLFSPYFEQLAAPEKKLDLEKLKENYLAAMKAQLDSSGEELAFSITSAGDMPFRTVYLQEIKSLDGWKAYLQKSLLGMLPAWKPFYESLGLSYDVSGVEKPSQYQDLEIYTLISKIDTAKFASGQAAKKGAFPFMGQPMKFEFSALKNLAINLGTWGGQADIKPLIDRISAGTSTFDLNQLGAGRKDGNAVVLFSFKNFANYLAQMATQDQTLKQATVPPEILQKLAGIDFPLLCSFKVEGETLRVSTSFPMEKILAVKNLFESKKPPAEPKKQPAQP